MGISQRLFNTWAASLVDEHTNTGGRDLSATTLRVIGILFLVTAAVVAILNLKRVANLGMLWLNAPLLVIGIAFVALSGRRK